MRERTAWCWSFTGWLLFVASAIFFIVASARSGDIISLIACILFFVACIAFMVPAWVKRPRH
ncbi:MAG: hypothetical protein KDC18_08465 [Alphaproteobacteria bacterium]|nr:hypothetical protein [Alphaproteobacteria bacterium]MCB1465302.1 hypothetical protein [Nitratireductor sp.]